MQHKFNKTNDEIGKWVSFENDNNNKYNNDDGNNNNDNVSHCHSDGERGSLDV